VTVKQTDTLAGIQLTPEGTETQKGIDFVQDEDRVRILVDSVRLQILRILREGIVDTITEESFDSSTSERLIRQKIVKRHSLSVRELIKLSSESDQYEKLTKNQIYHHLPKLIEAGFVVKHGVVTRGKRTTDYYRRTSQNFVTYGLHYEPERFREEIYKETSKVLPVFRLDLTEELREELLDLAVQIEVMRYNGSKEINNLVQDDITEPKAVEMFDWLLWIYAIGNEDYLRLMQKVRAIVFKDY
jgi:DNA-binding transcriptional ArsR family regulator